MDVFSAFDAMSQLAEWANKPPVALAMGECVHDLHKEASCDRCVTACPTGTLSWTGEHVQLDAETCVRCGYCVHACPTGAIRGNIEADKLLKAIDQEPDIDHIELVCPHRTPPHTQYDAKATVFITPRCLAGVPASSYVRLSNQGVKSITLRLDACEDCPIGSLATQIHETADHAQAMTVTSPQTSLQVITDASDAQTPLRLLRDSNRKQMSRRGLFKMFTGEDEGHTTNEMPVTQGKIPLERQRLLTALADRSGTFKVGVPLPEVTGSCTACEVCARICPTDALAVEKDRDIFTLSVDAMHCTACNLCADACPENVLHIGEAHVVGSPVDNQKLTLTTGALQTCQRCKTQFSGTKNLCAACDFRRRNPFGSNFMNQNGAAP